MILCMYVTVFPTPFESCIPSNCPFFLGTMSLLGEFKWKNIRTILIYPYLWKKKILNATKKFKQIYETRPWQYFLWRWNVSFLFPSRSSAQQSVFIGLIAIFLTWVLAAWFNLVPFTYGHIELTSQEMISAQWMDTWTFLTHRWQR